MSLRADFWEHGRAHARVGFYVIGHVHARSIEAARGGGPLPF